MKIIGIDPGITATGFGLIEDGQCIGIGTIRSKKKNVYEKINEICGHLEKVIKDNKPDLAALEKVFYHKNILTLMRSSELRGAIILALFKQNIKIIEFTPTQIKLTTTGNGRASKAQVRYFMERMLQTGGKRISNHATDALSIAYTAARKLKSKL